MAGQRDVFSLYALCSRSAKGWQTLRDAPCCDSLVVSGFSMAFQLTLDPGLSSLHGTCWSRPQGYRTSLSEMLIRRKPKTEPVTGGTMGL